MVGINPTQGNKIIKEFQLFLLGIFIFCQKKGIMEEHVNISVHGTVIHPWIIHHPHLIHFCTLHNWSKSSSFFWKQNVLTTYRYQQISTKFQVNWTSSDSTIKCSKVDVPWNLLKMLSLPNDTPIFGKFHNTTFWSLEAWIILINRELLYSFYGEDMLLRIENWI